MSVERTVRLRFGQEARTAGTHTNLSAVRSDGPVLWVAGDETATVERLVADDPRDPAEFRDQTTYRLADFVDLPGTDGAEEADIEGLARHGDFLWAVGSHSLRRRRIKARHTGEKALSRLARVTGQANRQVLVRIPVTEVDGLPTLVRELEVAGVRHRAAVFGAHGTDLRDLLADDEHLAPFLPIPGGRARAAARRAPRRPGPPGADPVRRRRPVPQARAAPRRPRRAGPVPARR
jgi:hypothetical protein